MIIGTAEGEQKLAKDKSELWVHGSWKTARHYPDLFSKVTFTGVATPRKHIAAHEGIFQHF